MDGKEASFDSSGYLVRPYSTVVIDGWRTSDKEVAQFLFSAAKDSYGVKKGKGSNLGVIGVAVFDSKYMSVENTTIATGYPFPKERYPFPFPKDPWAFGTGPSNITWTTTLEGGSVGTGGTGGSGILSSNETNRSIMLSAAGASSINDVVSVSYNNGVMRSVKQEIGTGWGSQKKSEVTTVEFDREDQPVALFEINYNTRAELKALGVSLEDEPVYVTLQSFPAESRYCEPPTN